MVLMFIYIIFFFLDTLGRIMSKNEPKVIEMSPTCSKCFDIFGCRMASMAPIFKWMDSILLKLCIEHKFLNLEFEWSRYFLGK